MWTPDRKRKLHATFIRPSRLAVSVPDSKEPKDEWRSSRRVFSRDRTGVSALDRETLGDVGRFRDHGAGRGFGGLLLVVPGRRARWPGSFRQGGHRGASGDAAR